MKIASLIGYGLLLSIATIYGEFSSAMRGAVPPTVSNHLVQPPPIFILDDTFKDDDWTVMAEATNGATYTVTQRLTGGIGSPPFRFMSHRLPPVSGDNLSTIRVTHIYLDAGYDPRVQGAIRGISYSESGIILSFPFADAFSTTQPVVVQDGRIYRSSQFIRFIASNSSHNWESKELLSLTESDFISTDGENPDFSADGNILQFGFSRSNSRSSTQPSVPGDQDLVIDQGVDHMQIMVLRQSDEAENRPPQAEDDIFILDGYKRSLPLFEIFNVVSSDSDPDQDYLEMTEVTEPLFGTASRLSGHTIVYQLDEPRAFDSFDYTISDGALTSTAKVDIYIDCACTVTCLNSLGLPEYASGQATGDIDLPLIYRVRDEVLQLTPDGRRYVEMYYSRNPEILVNILANELLRGEALHTVELWQPSLRNLTEGDGAARINQEQIDALEKLLTDLSDASSGELQQVIAVELQRLGPLDSYVGLTVKEAKKRAIGDAMLHLPHVQRFP